MSKVIAALDNSLRTRRHAILAAAAAALATAAPALGQAQTWTLDPGTPGSFIEPNNWDTLTAPTSATIADIANGGTATVTAADATPAVANVLVLGRNGTSLASMTTESGTLNISGGTLSLNEFRVGGKGTASNGGGSGTVVQTGGDIAIDSTNTTQGFYLGDGGIVGGGNTAVGNYTISNGSLKVGVNGGVNAAFGFLIVGAGGIGTNAAFTQNGGAVYTSNYMQVGRGGTHATYEMNAGTLETQLELNVGDNTSPSQGTFNQNHGAVTSHGVVVVGRRAGNGFYNITNDSTLTADGTFNVGGITGVTNTNQGGIGTFTQSGTSVVTAKGNMYIGVNQSTSPIANGSYTLNSGTLNVGTTNSTMNIGTGSASTGTYSQKAGGTLNVAGLLLVGANNGVGSVNVTGGTITTTGTATNNGIWIGGGPSQTSGTGTFTMDKTNNVIATPSVTTAFELSVGRGASTGNTANGTLNLNAGVLTVNRASAIGMYVGGGPGSTGTVNQDGGELKISQSTSGIEVGNTNGSGTYNLISGKLTAPLMRDAAGTGTKNINFSGGTYIVTNMNLNNGNMSISGGSGTITALATNTGNLFINGASPNITTLTLSTSTSTVALRAGGNVNLSGSVVLGATNVQVDDGGSLTWSGNVSRSAGGTITKVGSGALTISGTQSYTGSAVYTVSQGTLNLNSNGGTNLTVNANSTTNFGSSQTLAALNVGPNTTATVTANGSRAVKANTLTVNTSGGVIDLSDNRLITQKPVGTFDGSNYTDTTLLIQSGRNGGSWTGSGIVTSQSTAQTSNLTSIGVATAQQVKGLATATDTGTWGGQAVTGSDTLVMYTYGGDANLDGKINVDDYGRIDFNAALGTSGWYNGDFNYDGKINVDDYGIIDFNVGIQGAPFPTSSSPLAGVANQPALSAVPEPTSVSLLALGAATAMIRRRKHFAFSVR